VGAGAKLLGAIEIGDDCRIGANSVLVKSVPANSVVVGVPGRPVTRSRAHAPEDDPDLQHTYLPDAIGAMLATLMARVDRLEQPSPTEAPPPRTPAPDAAGIWHDEDFQI
jgi:serine O-acetyltransferase